MRERGGNPLYKRGMCANVKSGYVGVSVFVLYIFCIVHAAYCESSDSHYSTEWPTGADKNHLATTLINK